MSVSNDLAARIELFAHCQMPYRNLVVQISRAEERRLEAFGRALNDGALDDELLALSHDSDFGACFVMAALRGLGEDETDRDKWADIDGQEYDLPRPVRAPWWMRAGNARRAAVRAWRAS